MYVRFVRGGKFEEHYLRWSDVYKVDLNRGYWYAGLFDKAVDLNKDLKDYL